MTWYTAAVDDRIAAAAPSCSTFTYGSQAEHWLAAGQCDCIYYMNSNAWDFPVVGALIAPRPLIILSGRKDSIFPPDGYHDVFQRVKRVYDLYANGDSDRIREVDEDVPHSDSPLLLAEARQWMQHWLQNDRTPVPLEEKPDHFEERPEDLAVLSTPPTDAINDRIHDRFVALPRDIAIESNDAWQKRRGELMTGLREKILGWFPKETVPFETQFTEGKGGWSGQYADYREATILTERGVRIRVERYLPRNSPEAVPLLVHVKRPIDTFYSSDYDERLPLVDRAAVLVVTPRFTDPMLSTADYTNIERTAAWTGRTIAALQVWDTLRAIEWAIEEQKLPATRVVLFGRENAAIVALYAALFDERIAGVILADPPASHWQGPALLNVLRVTDIPEVAAALAPRELMFLRAVPPGFAKTETILKQLERTDSMQVVGSLAAGIGISK
jgi:hypothetical protein